MSLWKVIRSFTWKGLTISQCVPEYCVQYYAFHLISELHILSLGYVYISKLHIVLRQKCSLSFPFEIHMEEKGNIGTMIYCIDSLQRIFV